jgi:CHAT domain-containing protein/tetratricopeptide (TPR) repeat protein
VIVRFFILLLLLLVPFRAGIAEPSAPVAEKRTISVEDMRKRDRFNKPSVEVAAWQAFLDQVLADPKSAPELIVEARIGLSLVLLNNSQGDRATTEVDTAAALFEKEHLEHSHIAPELYEALLFQNTYDPPNAIIYGEKALKLARQLYGEESAMVARMYLALSNAYMAKGDLFEQRRYGCLAAERAEAHIPPTNSLRVAAIMFCGMAGTNLDDDSAYETVKKGAALAYANLPQDNMYYTVALYGAGSALLHTGRYAESEAVYRHAFDMSRATFHADSIETNTPAQHLVEALRLQGKLTEAEAIERDMIAFVHRINGSKSGGTLDVNGASLVELALILELQGRFDEALHSATQGLKELKDFLPKEDTDVALAGVTLARLLAVKGQYTRAIALAQDAIPYLEKGLGANHRKTLRAKMDLAAILDRMHRDVEAFSMAQTQAGKVESQLFDLAARHANLVSLSQVVTGVFADHALIALHARHFEDAVRAAQLSVMSELTLVNAELAARAVARSKGLSPLIAQLRTAQGKLQTLQTKLVQVESGQKGDAPGLNADIKVAQVEVERLNAQIISQFPAYAKMARPQPIALRDLQARLTDAQALILPLNLVDRVATIAVTRQRVFWAEAKGSGRAVNALVARIRSSIDEARLVANPKSASFDGRAAHALYRALLPGHLDAAIARKSEWLFPSSGLASNIPAALLLTRAPKPGEDLAQAPWLIRSHAVSVISDFTLPSAGDAHSGHARFAGIGDPALGTITQQPVQYAALFRGGIVSTESIRALPSLPGAGSELGRMAAAFGGKAHILLQKEATEAAVKAFDFTPYSVVAFATHGLTSGEVNGLSEPALVLTPPFTANEADDGLLTASEIAQLNIPADWVILSACNSGSGRNATAPTFSGLARAFRMAGARSFLLSHWPVRDDVAARLTVASVKNAVNGLSKAEALRRAILSLIKDKKVPMAAHPATWAPFVIIGN